MLLLALAAERSNVSVHFLNKAVINIYIYIDRLMDTNCVIQVCESNLVGVPYSAGEDNKIYCPEDFTRSVLY